MTSKTENEELINKFYEYQHKINTDPEILYKRFLFRLALNKKRQESGTKAYKKLFR